ncbi:MAG: beta-lactamase family protein [Oceanospirillaceae bacterium]|nr:beta-lactamase family protein [Oceanospirillaceae bacterium]
MIKIFKVFLVFMITNSTLLAGDNGVNVSKIAQLLAELTATNQPGIQYVVVNSDSVIFEYSAGQADIKNKVALSSGHTMAAFSMTKTLTAIGILQLFEQHKIQLDDEISLYVEHPYSVEITIRQLLSHTSGLPDPLPLKWVHLAKQHNGFNEKKALEKVLLENPKASSLPGEKYQYSNIGYWLLGGVIEKVSGLSYSQYIRKNIFEPLHLSKHEIGFSIVQDNNHAKGYLKKYSFMNLLKPFLIEPTTWADYEENWLHINNVYLNGPAFGGAIGSASAFSRILQSLLSEQSVLLSAKTKQHLYAQQQDHSGNSIDMTLGWHIGELNDNKYYFKEGGGAGFHAEMRIYPEMNLATVLMVNRTSFNTNKYLSKLDLVVMRQ